MKLKSLGMAVAALTFAGSTLAGGVAAADAPAVQPAASAKLPKDCSEALGPYKVKTNVKVRTHAKTGATALGLWTTKEKGWACNGGKSYKGGSYKLCGKSSNQWVYVSGVTKTRGWVPETCIKGR